MDNEQLNSNLNQLIINQDEIVKNQIEICEVIKDLTKQVKKIRKPKKTKEQKETDAYFKSLGVKKAKPCINNIFGNPVEQLDKITFKQAEPKQDQKYYLCIKDFSIFIKEGQIFKKWGNDYIAINDLCYIKTDKLLNNPNHFIPIQQFETLKEGQEIEFTLRNGKTYKANVKTNVKTNDVDWYLKSPPGEENDQPFKDLNQLSFKDSLNKKYDNYGVWPNSPTLEDLTKDLNTLITLPDLSVKQPDQTDLRKQANDLVDKFMPLVNGWAKMDKADRPLIAIIGNAFWSYSDLNQRKAAIKCAIVHCELVINDSLFMECKKYSDIKSELQKMLSE